MALNIIDLSSGNATPLPGQVQAQSAMLFAILCELRTHTQYLYAIASGLVSIDQPESLRADVLIDPTIVKSS